MLWYDSTYNTLLRCCSACNVLYINSADMESLTGPEALSRAITATFNTTIPPMATDVHFKVSSLGITLTDVKHRCRQHFIRDWLGIMRCTHQCCVHTCRCYFSLLLFCPRLIVKKLKSGKFFMGKPSQNYGVSVSSKFGVTILLAARHKRAHVIRLHPSQ